VTLAVAIAKDITDFLHSNLVKLSQGSLHIYPTADPSQGTRIEPSQKPLNSHSRSVSGSLTGAIARTVSDFFHPSQTFSSNPSEEPFTEAIPRVVANSYFPSFAGAFPKKSQERSYMVSISIKVTSSNIERVSGKRSKCSSQQL